MKRFKLNKYKVFFLLYSPNYIIMEYHYKGRNDKLEHLDSRSLLFSLLLLNFGMKKFFSADSIFLVFFYFLSEENLILSFRIITPKQAWLPF